MSLCGIELVNPDMNSSNNRDEIFAGTMLPGDFVFDAKVANVFEDMINWQQLGAGWTAGGAVALLAFQLLGPAFWWWQNRSPDRVGGAISALKAQWLVFVVTLWIVAPLLVIGQTEALLICWLLAGSMLLRGIIELH